MMIMETSTRRPPLEPVLPLINVVFLLLIFFMLAGQLAKRPVVPVETPNSASANAPEARDTLLLVLKADSQWFAEGDDVPLDPLALHDLLAEQDDYTQVRLQADAAITMDALREHLSDLQGLGVKQVRLVTRREVGNAAFNSGNRAGEEQTP